MLRLYCELLNLNAVLSLDLASLQTADVFQVVASQYQGRNGLRAQSPKFDWDQGSEERAQGSEEWDQGSQGF